MTYMITPLVMIVYGLVVYYDLYTPSRGGGDNSVTGLILIIVGVVFIVLIPYFKKLEKKDAKVEDTPNKEKKDYCLAPLILGLILFGLYLFEITTNLFVFILAILLMSFCRDIVEFFTKKKR